jgi:hypothetical protein
MHEKLKKQHLERSPSPSKRSPVVTRDHNMLEEDETPAQAPRRSARTKALNHTVGGIVQIGAESLIALEIASEEPTDSSLRKVLLSVRDTAEV